MSDTPWIMGFDAALCGIGAHNNPFHPHRNAASHAAWLRGWLARWEQLA